MQTRLQARLIVKERETFHFLDLPPELRNAIYVELLTIREKDEAKKGLALPQTSLVQKYCYPRILQTCRQIHQEAAGYLRTDDLELDISYVVCEGRYTDDTGARRRCFHHSTPNSIECYINSRRLLLDSDNSDVTLLTAPTAIWPSILGKISKLHLEVDFCSPPTIHLNDPVLAQAHNTNVLQLNHSLYDLQNFLVGSRKSKAISVNLQYHGEATFAVEGVVAPIGRSRLAKEVKMRKNNQRTTTLRPQPPRGQVEDEVAYAFALGDALQSQIEAMGEGTFANKQEVRKMRVLKRNLERAMSFPGFVTKSSEQPLCEAIKEAVACLKELAEDFGSTFSWTEFKRNRHSREGRGRLLLAE